MLRGHAYPTSIEDTPDAAAFVVRAPHGQTEMYESSRWKEYPVYDE